MCNAIEVMFFESRTKVKIISSALYYAKLIRLKSESIDLESKNILTACLRQVVENIQSQNRMFEFQNALVKISKYKLKR